MSLSKRMLEQLRLLAAEGPAAVRLDSAADTYKTLTVSDTGLVARLELCDYDRYSVALRSLEVGAAQPFEGDPQALLSAQAAEIARRLSYLEEPLAVWELDGRERLAQLRSSPPLREGDEVSYWEVSLRADAPAGARITRYRWAPKLIEREVILYPATFVTVARMVESLVDALKTVEG